nr:cadherin-like domain-containing protein [Sulfurimonas sp. SAG-AH-194-C20]
MADNNETFTVNIDAYVEPTTGDKYENVTASGTVTTTITDDTGTPNTPNDGPEDDQESVIIKLVAADVNGDPIFEADGITYTYVNDAQEGSVAQYIAVAFAPDETVFTTDTEITPNGTVDVTFADSSATGASTQTAIDGTQDYDNDGQTVTVGQAFSTAIFDDYLKEGTHDFVVNITTGSYTPPSATTGYENVVESGSVTTTIGDDEVATTPPGDETPNEPIDTVYVQISNNDSTIEGGELTHTLTLVDKDGNTVNIPSGSTITVDLTYTSSNGVVDGDFTTIVKQVQITNGTSTTLTNVTLDDFTQEGTENYTVTITGVSDDNDYFENLEIDSANDSATGEIVDGVYIGTPENSAVDEDNFDVTSSTSTITDTGLLGVVAPTGDNAYTLGFDGSPTFTSDDGAYVALTSNGTTIEYVVSGDTTTAYSGAGRANSDRVFVITLDKNSAGGSDDNYTYTQYQNIDHPTTDVDDDIVLTFGFNVTDGSVSSNTVNFTVTVNDSLPNGTNQNLTLDEDSSQLIIISQESFDGGNITLNNGTGDQVVASNTSIDIYDTSGDDVVGTLLNNGDGTLTFTPSTDYSGDTAGFTYSVSDTDGDTAAATVSLTVTPKADGATIANGSASTLEDTSVTINLNAPVVKDATDINDINGATAQDASELLGLISLENMRSGVEILKGSDDSVLWTSTGTSDIVYILLSDGPHTADTIAAFSADANNITMTTAEFEALKVNPDAQEHNNIDIKMSVTEYEVDDSGNILADSAVVGTNGVTTTNNFLVDVEAVTDAISLAFDSELIDAVDVGTISTTTIANDTFTYDATLSEGAGNTIDLKQLLSSTTGASVDSLDGSEYRSYIISGVPEGTVVTFGDKSATADVAGELTISPSWNNDTNADVNFSMTLPEQYSGTLNATITLSVYDTDSDTVESVTTETATVYFSATVGAVADVATLSIVQPKGYEDAGRTGSNDEDSATGAATIDAPENGIAVDIKVKSSDTDGSEYFNVTIDGIPDGASMYVYDTVNTSWVLVDNTSANVGDVEITDNVDGTWQVLLNNYDISDGTFTTNTPKFIPVHNSNADVTLQVSAETVDSDGTSSPTANSATLEVLIQVEGVADIPVNTATVTMDRTTDLTDDADDIYAAVLDENNSGTVIALESVLENYAGLDSYDNSGSEGSEVLTVILSGLSSDFSVSGSGATFMGGTGTSRKWVIANDELDLVDITTPGSYAGEVDFQFTYITTENDGDSKTSAPQDVKVLIRPIDEATVSGTTEVNEDILTQVNITLNTDDSNESLETIKILKSDVDGKEFDLFVNGVQLNSDTASSDGTYYTLSATDALNNLYVQYNSDLGTSSDNSFTIVYTTADTATGLSDGNGDLVDLSAEKTVTINLNLSAVTDDISIEAANIVATDGDITVDVSSTTERVTINDTGSFTVDVALTALASDNSDTDTDGSEAVTRLVVEGVPLGISVTDGEFAQTAGGTNLWFIDIPDTQLDGSYTITFTVNDDLALDTGTENSVIITAYNEDGAGSVITTATTEMVFIDNIPNTGGTTQSVVADLALKAYDVVEDTNFTLFDILDITPDATRNDEAYSVSFSVVDNVSVSTSSLDNLKTYDENGQTVYVLNIGTDDIQTALQSITLVPEANYNENNDQGTQLEIEATLTAYVPNTSITSNDTENFIDADVTPVTDALSAAAVNGTIDEDNSYSFDLVLTTVDDLDANGNFASDGANADGSDYTVIGDVTISRSGIDGELRLADTTLVVFDGSGNATISTADLVGLVFTPAQDLAGQAVFTYSATTQENGAANQENGGGTITIDVNPIADGLDLSALDATGTEFTDANANKYTEVTIGSTLLDTDGSESITTLILDDIPDGFLVYFGADGAQALAQNAGDNGTGNNSWSIDISGGIPQVWIAAPEYWSGSVANMKVVTYVNDSNSIQRTETNFTLVVAALASTITIDPTKTFADNYDWTELNINANMKDLDGSETMSLTLEGATTALDATAQFQLINGSSVDASFDVATSIWTLSNIASDQINNIQIAYHEYSDTINVSAVTVDGTDTLATAVTGTFTMDIAATTDTGAGDDTILTDGDDAINTGAGEDTIILTQGATLDFTLLDNIETIDLTDNGDHTLASLSLDDIVSMTDSDNLLTITGDAGDSVSAIDTTGWTQDAGNVDAESNGDGTSTYQYSNGSDSITLTVDDQIDSTGL